MTHLAALLLPWCLPSPAAQDVPLLTLWVEDAAECFRDPKDAALIAALRLVDDRVLELPGELPTFDLPEPLVPILARALTCRKSLRIHSSKDPSLMVPIYGQLELQGLAPESAEETAQIVLGMLGSQGFGLGTPLASGLVPIEPPGPPPIPLHLGARKGPGGAPDAFVLSVGKLLDEPGMPGATGLPKGVRPSLAVHLDYGGIAELVGGLMAMGSPDEAEMFQSMMEAFGMNDLVLDGAIGSDERRSYSMLRMPGWAGALRQRGLLGGRGLTPSDLARIPSDAGWAGLSTVNLGGLVDVLLGAFGPQLAEMGMEDPLGTIASMTGFHLKTDLLDNLGGVYGCYTSDTTGGGGMTSCVAFVELANAEGMLATLERAQDLIDGLGASEARGYLRTKSWQRAGADLITLTFPGVPVPVEPTLAVADGFLYLGLTPQATIAAVDHARSGSKGLLANERFAADLPASIEGAMAISFLDNARMLREGYACTSLLCSAIANATRSRASTERDAGVVMPSFQELGRGVRANVSVTRVEGDDLVAVGYGDRSLLVTATGAVGMLSSTPMVLLPMLAGGAMTAARRSTYEAAAYEEWVEIEGQQGGEEEWDGGGDGGDGDDGGGDGDDDGGR